MLKRILVGLGDVATSEVAVRHAVELCLAHEAELTVVTVVDHKRLENVGPIPIGGGAAAAELREHRLKLTHEIVEEAIAHCETVCNAAGVKFRLLYEEGEPLDCIVSAARYHDLMILGKDEKLFEHGVINEPSNELVRLVSEGVQPILVVTKQQRPIRRAMIAYSGSMGSAKTMKLFARMRLCPEATLRIVTFDKPQDEAKQLLADAADYCRAHGYEPETEHVAESAYSRLLPYATEQGFDMLVVGNSRGNLLLKRLFGETALNVFRNSPLPFFASQ